MTHLQTKRGVRMLAAILTIAGGILAEGRAEAQISHTSPGSWINYGMNWAKWGIDLGTSASRLGGSSCHRRHGCSSGWIGHNDQYWPYNGYGTGGYTSPPVSQYYDPQPTTYTEPPQSAPPKNAAPTQPPPQNAPKPNTVEQKPADAPSNANGLPQGASLTGPEADEAVADRQEDNQEAGDDSKKLVTDTAKQDPAFGKLGFVEQQKYLNALEAGDTEKALEVLEAARDANTINENDVKQLMRHVRTVEAIDEFVEQADKGRYDADDANEMVDLLVSGGYVTQDEDQDALVDSVVSLHTNSALIEQLENAGGGNGGFPPGLTTIIASGGLAEGQMVLLGGGAVVIGTGDPQDGLVMGYGNAAQLAGMCVGIGDPVADARSAAVDEGVVLTNGGDSVVQYTVDGQTFSMPPGYRQKLPAGKTWTVAFDRGDSYGTATYGLEYGTYRFTPTEKGWELYKHTYKVTLDNSQSNFDFQFLLNNNLETLPAGQVAEFEHDYPLEMRFDDGYGNEQRKSLQSETYVVAVSPQGTLDLYLVENVAPPISIADVLPPSRPDAEEVLANPQRALGKMTNHEFTPRLGRPARAVATSRGSIFGGL